MLKEKQFWPEDKFSEDISEELRSSKNVSINVKFIEEPKLKLSSIIHIENYSSFIKVLKVSFYVLKFLNTIYQKLLKKDFIKVETFYDCELLWLMEIQCSIINSSNFNQWKILLNLFVDAEGIIRSRSRLPDVEHVTYDQRHPILLPSSNYFTSLIILYTHQNVCHAGTESTLSELRLKYWVIKGRQIVRKVIRLCFICKRIMGKVLQPPPSPLLPEFRISAEYPFQVTGFDFAGPLFAKDIYS